MKFLYMLNLFTLVAGIGLNGELSYGYSESGLQQKFNVQESTPDLRLSLPVEGPVFTSMTFQNATDGLRLESGAIHYSRQIRGSFRALGFETSDVQIESHKGGNSEYDFSGQKISISASTKKVFGYQLTASGGVNQFVSSFNNLSASPNGDLIQTFAVGHTEYRLQNSYDLFYFSSPNSLSLKENTKSQFNSLSLESAVTDYSKLRASISYQLISDGNQMLGSDSSYLFKLGDMKPLWIGFGGGIQHYAFYRYQYWTPVRNFSIGPRAETYQSISKNLSVHFSASLGCGNDVDGKLGWGTYHEAGASYAFSDITLSAAYVGMGAVPAYDGWFQKSWTIAGSGNF